MDIPTGGIEIAVRVLQVACDEQCTITVVKDGYTYTAAYLPFEGYIHEEGRPAVRLTVERSADGPPTS